MIDFLKKYTIEFFDYDPPVPITVELVSVILRKGGSQEDADRMYNALMDL